MARSRGVYNNVYTPEKWEQVNPENKEILDDFLTEYRQQKKSPTTINGYFQDLRIVLIKIMEDFNNKSVLNMTKKDFRRLNLWFDESGMSAARCNRIHSAVNSMLTFCENEDDYDYEDDSDYEDDYENYIYVIDENNNLLTNKEKFIGTTIKENSDEYYEYATSLFE